jgi:hypothetical protein
MSRAPSKLDAWEPEDGAPVYTSDQLDKMDRKFVKAMLAAIAAGLEHAPIGVCSAPNFDYEVIS